MTVLFYICIGMIIGIIIGYVRISNCFVRYYQYKFRMTERDANNKVISIIRDFKYIKKNHYINIKDDTNG